MDITVDRFKSNDDATVSNISVDGTFVCFGLEDEYREEKVARETRIPSGTYAIGLRKEGGFHNRYTNRFPDMHRGMLHILDVPGFEYILIHIGNTDEDTAGCLLVGSNASVDDGELRVTSSRLAYQKLYPMLVTAADQNELTITFIDNDRRPPPRPATRHEQQIALEPTANTISAQQLSDLFPRAKRAHTESFQAQAPELLREFGITEDTTRLHFFLAQIGHESGGLTITAENLNYRAERLRQVWPSRFRSLDAAMPFSRNPEALANNVYASRMGNGPPESGDGWRFRGRGYIQITGRDGYSSVGSIAGLDLVENPDLASDPAHALHVACAFWRWKKLNALCTPAGFVKVTKRINGGVNGLTDRREWLDKVERILGAHDVVDRIPDDAHDLVAVQRALQGFGYTEVGAADGLWGTKTHSAIQRFRREHGLPAGRVDDTLLMALGLGA